MTQLDTRALIADLALDVKQRFTQTKQERDKTNDSLRQGSLIAANDDARLERRKIRLLNNKAIVKAIGKEAAYILASAPVSKAPASVVRMFEGVIEGRDMQPAWFLPRGTKVRRTVGRIHIRTEDRRSGWGTGFLVGPNLLLTNHHVLESPQWAKLSRVEFEYEESYEGFQLSSAYFTLRPDVVYISYDHRNSGLDFVLVAVDYKPQAGSVLADCTLNDFGFNRLFSESGKLVKGEPIHIIHHPKGLMRQLCIRNNRLVAIDEPILEETWMHYETDTLSGSSGSPLFNSQWEVVGLHHAGIEHKDEDDRPLAIGGGLWDKSMGEERLWYEKNEGLRISKFLTEIRNRIDKPVKNQPERQTIISELGASLIEVMLNPSTDAVCKELPLTAGVPVPIAGNTKIPQGVRSFPQPD